MKRTKFLTPEEKKEQHLDRIVAELGSDVIGKLHRAFELTAAALYRRAAEKAQAELNEQQH